MRFVQEQIHNVQTPVLPSGATESPLEIGAQRRKRTLGRMTGHVRHKDSFKRSCLNN